MASPAETAQSIREALEPFVRPREEAIHIRRVLAAHLAACLKSDDTLDQHPALAAVDGDVAPLAETRGLQRAYLQALQRNLEARRAFEAVKTAASALPTPPIAATPPDRRGGSGFSVLDDHLTAVRLARKKERLQTVHRYLDTLQAKPAASTEDFLQPAAIYGEASRTLPSVPQAVVDGLAEEAAEEAAEAAASGRGVQATTASATVDLARLTAQLEKALLRAQLLLRQEETKLAAVKAQRSSRRPTSAAAKLQALGTTRDALIAWMETELGNATDEGGGGGGGDEDESRLLRQSLLGGDGTGSGGGGSSKARIDDKVAAIREKYGRYVELRKTLVQMASGSSRTTASSTAAAAPLFASKPPLAPPERSLSERDKAGAASAGGQDKRAAALGQLLLAPYLARLLAVAHNQRADIAHKAHYHVLLAKRLKDTCQMLDHLADESQLLPQHPQPGQRRKSAHDMLSGPRERPEGAAHRVAAWTFAADEAKIATFEAVAEQVEAGQVALEQAAETLDEADALLGRDGHDGSPDDIWERLHGELGVIGT